MKTKHEQLNELLNPLVDFMSENGFHYFLVVGQDGTCARHINGDFYEVSRMIMSFMSDHKHVDNLIKYCAEVRSGSKSEAKSVVQEGGEV